MKERNELTNVPVCYDFKFENFGRLLSSFLPEKNCLIILFKNIIRWNLSEKFKFLPK